MGRAADVQGRRLNLALVGPTGTGKSHTLIALGHAAVGAGHKVRYFTAADLVETLYRAMADNSVGRTIETLLRNDVVVVDEVGFAPLDDTGTQLLFPSVRRRRLRTPLPGHRLALVLRGLGPVPARAHHRRQHPRPPPAPRHRRHHQRQLLPDARVTPTPRRPADHHLTNREGWGLLLGHQRGLPPGH